VNAEQAKRTALDRFAAQGPGHANCAQTVFLFALLLLSEEEESEEQDVLTLAKYMGGGMAGAGETCGALTGCALALGARDSAWARASIAAPDDSPDRLRAIIRDFVRTFGTCRCRELTGYDLSTPEGFQAFKASEASSRCPEYVGWVCDRLVPLLERSSETSPSNEPGGLS